MTNYEKMNTLFELYKEGLISKTDLANTIKTLDVSDAVVNNEKVATKLETNQTNEKPKSDVKDNALYVITNEKELTRENYIDVVGDQVAANSRPIENDNKINPYNIAYRIVSWAESLKKTGYCESPDIAISFSFPKVVDANMNHVNNNIAKYYEDSIVKVNAHLTSSETMSFNETLTQFFNAHISGYVDFQRFVHTMAELGYVMVDDYYMGPELSDMYDESGNLELDSLKKNVSSKYADFYSTHFVEKEKVIKNGNLEETNKGFSR